MNGSRTEYTELAIVGARYFLVAKRDRDRVPIGHLRARALNRTLGVQRVHQNLSEGTDSCGGIAVGLWRRCSFLEQPSLELQELKH